MTNLLDTIKKQTEAPQSTAPQLGETEQVKSLVQAKSGKEAAPSSGPRQSAIGERMASRQAELAGKQIGQQQAITGEQQQQQAADIEQRGQQQERQFQEKRDAQKQQFQLANDRLLNEYATGNKKLSTQEDVANLEQIGFNLRLGNEQYVNNLQQEGQKARLDDKNEFQYQMAKDTFNEVLDLDMNKNAFNSIMAMDDREFAESLGQYRIEEMLMDAEHQAATGAARSMASGIGNLLSGAISTVGMLKKNDTQDTDVITPTAKEESLGMSMESQHEPWSLAKEMEGK